MDDQMSTTGLAATGGISRVGLDDLTAAVTRGALRALDLSKDDFAQPTSGSFVRPRIWFGGLLDLQRAGVLGETPGGLQAPTEGPIG